MCRLGASVVGIDACKESVEAASAHASKSKDSLRALEYRCTTVEELAEREGESAWTAWVCWCTHLMPTCGPLFVMCAHLCAAGTFDIVVASEVVEHVADVPRFLQSCAALGKVRLVCCRRHTLPSLPLHPPH